MKKIIIFLLLTNIILLGSTKIISAKYNITYGKYLPLGIANAILRVNNQNYEISIEAKATGLAKVLSRNRIEIYKSFGKIINHEFIPEKFIKIRKDTLKNRIRTYTFDRKKQKIDVNDKKKEHINKLDSNFKKITKTINKEKNKKLNYYASQDILSLFFNLKNKIHTYKKEENYKLKAVGANKTKGIISIILPNEKIKELKTKDSIHVITYINQKIFGSTRGELFLSLNKEGFCNKAILKDVLLFGDIVGEMVEFEIKD